MDLLWSHSKRIYSTDLGGAGTCREGGIDFSRTAFPTAEARMFVYRREERDAVVIPPGARARAHPPDSGKKRSR